MVRMPTRFEQGRVPQWNLDAPARSKTQSPDDVIGIAHVNINEVACHQLEGIPLMVAPQTPVTDSVSPHQGP